MQWIPCGLLSVLVTKDEKLLFRLWKGLAMIVNQSEIFEIIRAGSTALSLLRNFKSREILTSRPAVPLRSVLLKNDPAVVARGRHVHATAHRGNLNTTIYCSYAGLAGCGLGAVPHA